MTSPQSGLLNDIITSELPAIVCRGIQCYAALRGHVESGGGDFWAAAPQTLVEWQGRLAAATNPLYDYLAMDDDDRHVIITKVPPRASDGKRHVTWLLDFKAKFESRMSTKFVDDPAVFAKFGFQVSEGMDNIFAHSANS